MIAETPRVDPGPAPDDTGRAISAALWLSIVIVAAVVVGFYRIVALEHWAQGFAQDQVAPLIGLVE